jgi:hypothetical protein
LDAAALRRAVVAPGYGLEVTSFVPEAGRAAPRPRYLGQRVSGLEVRVRDPRQVRPWELGVRLLAALRDLGRLEWRSEDALDRLVGSRGLRLGLESGATPEALLAADAGAVSAFRSERRAALLY